MTYLSQVGDSFNYGISSCADSVNHTIAQGRRELNAVDSAIRNVAKGCKNTIDHSIESAVEKMHDMKSNVETGTQRFVSELEAGLYIGVVAVKIGLDETAKKICDFMYDYSFAFVVVAGSCATLYFAPELFIAGAIVSFIARVEFKNLINKYIKDEYNPYFDNAKFGPQYLSTTDTVLATAAAVDAVILGTFYFTPYLAVSLLPVLSGVVAGNALAKVAMDFFQREKPENNQEDEVEFVA